MNSYASASIQNQKQMTSTGPTGTNPMLMTAIQTPIPCHSLPNQTVTRNRTHYLRPSGEIKIKGGRYPGTLIRKSIHTETYIGPIPCRQCLCPQGRCRKPIGIFPSGWKMKFLAHINNREDLSYRDLCHIFEFPDTLCKNQLNQNVSRRSNRRYCNNIRVRFSENTSS